MNWNDYEGLWKRQELPLGAAADLPALRATFEAKRRKLAKTLFARDLLEGSAGLLVSGVFGYTWWHIGKEGWPIALAIGLILGVSAFFARERIRAHRNRLGPGVPLLARLEAEIAELQHQRQLLLHVWSWYLAPCVGAMAIIFFTVIRILRQTQPDFFPALWAHPAALAWIFLYFALVLPGCYWGIWAMNRRAVRRQIEPRLEELSKLRADLLATN